MHWWEQYPSAENHARTPEHVVALLQATSGFVRRQALSCKSRLKNRANEPSIAQKKVDQTGIRLIPLAGDDLWKPAPLTHVAELRYNSRIPSQWPKAVRSDEAFAVSVIFAHASGQQELALTNTGLVIYNDKFLTGPYYKYEDYNTACKRIAADHRQVLCAASLVGICMDLRPAPGRQFPTRELYDHWCIVGGEPLIAPDEPLWAASLPPKIGALVLGTA